jgi:dienelactone hydrolase
MMADVAILILIACPNARDEGTTAADRGKRFGRHAVLPSHARSAPGGDSPRRGGRRASGRRCKGACFGGFRGTDACLLRGRRTATRAGRDPLEYFERAIEWLKSQPEVDTNCIAVVGNSKGGELALLLGVTYPEDVRAIIGYAPSAVVWQGITFDREAY